jgi:predicted membrane-bound spermidine synthase
MLPRIQKTPSYITIKEISDPSTPIEYSGLSIAECTSNVQSWTILQTGDGDEMLFIDNYHQSSKSDEFRYHETFVHSLLGCLKLDSPKKVLVLGGAEGCMLREILKWKTSVTHITQVDWDSTLVNYFKHDGAVWNHGAYNDPRVHYVCDEAIHYLETTINSFDIIFVDLLDPYDTSMIFMKNLLSLSKKRLNPGGAISVNGGRVYTHETAICKVAEFMKQEFNNPRFSHKAIRVHVPSYQGIWCFLMAAEDIAIDMTNDLPKHLKYFNKERFEHNTEWSQEYPTSIRTFSGLTDKKLTQIDHDLITKVFEHHGC